MKVKNLNLNTIIITCTDSLRQIKDAYNITFFILILKDKSILFIILACSRKERI